MRKKCPSREERGTCHWHETVCLHRHMPDLCPSPRRGGMLRLWFLSWHEIHRACGAHDRVLLNGEAGGGQASCEQMRIGPGACVQWRISLWRLVQIGQ